SLAGLAETAGASRFVHLLGARDDVPAVLNALDVFVLSSSTEGLPLVIPEAMMTALPVVATAVGGVPTVVDEGVTGCLVPPGDEALLRDRLARLQGDPSARRSYGESARSAACARFSSARMLGEYQDLYERLLDGRPRRDAAPK